VPVLVLDFHGDITPEGVEETLFRFDYAHNDAYINPFHLDRRYPLIPLQLRDEFIEAWRAVYPTLGVHQVNYLVELIDRAFTEKGITRDPATWDRGIDFGDVIRQFDASEADSSVREKIRGYMRTYVDSQIFHGGAEVAVERFLDESVRLDLSKLQGSTRTILADVVLRRLFLLVKSMGPLMPDTRGWAKFRSYVVIDEAQVLMASQGEIEASLAKYAAEARKFGIGLILATQLKDNVPDAIWGNIDTRLFMQALDRQERVKNARALGVTEDELASLRQGQAILTVSSQPHQPRVRLQIDPPWI
jgi:DNA helicase HerA-like ATPase